VQRIVGEFTIAAVHSLPLQALWRRTEEHAGINREYFEMYFEDCEVGHAIEVGTSRLYEAPVPLDVAVGLERPPQSFCYVDGEVFRTAHDA
jgi:predicted transcriptional regulator